MIKLCVVWKSTLGDKCADLAAYIEVFLVLSTLFSSFSILCFWFLSPGQQLHSTSLTETFVDDGVLLHRFPAFMHPTPVQRKCSAFPLMTHVFRCHISKFVNIKGVLFVRGSYGLVSAKQLWLSYIVRWTDGPSMFCVFWPPGTMVYFHFCAFTVLTLSVPRHFNQA